MTIRRMASHAGQGYTRTRACTRPRDEHSHTHTHTHKKYLILITFSLQQWLRERASVLRYMYIACLVKI